jgi:hypothetical protein
MTTNTSLNNEISQKSSACNVTGCGLEDMGSPDQPRSPTNLLSERYRTHFPSEYNGRNLELTARFHLVSRLRMRADPICNILMALCLRVKNNLTFNFLSYCIIIKTIILPAVLYGCETWSLILRKEHRLRVFENRVLRRIFGPKANKVIGGWRKLHNEDLHNLHCSPMIKSSRMR